MKILSICASGAGTSMIMKTKIKKLVDNLGIEVEEIKSLGLEEAKKALDKFDLVFVSDKLARELGENPKLRTVKNLLDDAELEAHLRNL